MRMRLFSAIATLLLASISVLGCGTGRTAEPVAGLGNSEERAFLSAMVEHHLASIEMARLAKSRADAPTIARLADDLIGPQEREILQMDAIHRRLFGAEVAPDPDAPARLGLSAREAGLDDDGAIPALEGAPLFDLAFLDRMVAHHRGAIALAGAALRLGTDAELRLLAETIRAAREAQIQEMTDFRADRYGAPTSTGEVDPSRTTGGAE